jgi:hypothetical protein
MIMVEEAASEKLIAQDIPSRTITDNMQDAVQQDSRVTQLTETLLKNFRQSRDSLRQALGESTAPTAQSKDN